METEAANDTQQKRNPGPRSIGPGREQDQAACARIKHNKSLPCHPRNLSASTMSRKFAHVASYQANYSPMSFEYFCRLPAELRVHIWRLAMPPREIHGFPSQEVRDAWYTEEAQGKWQSFYDGARLLFEVMPSSLSQVCHESRAAVQGYRNGTLSCDEASLPAWIDWERDFVSCSQDYAAMFRNVEWSGRIQNMTIKVDMVEEFDESRWQPLKLLEDWLSDIKNVTLLPSPKYKNGCRISRGEYVWPLDWFILLEIMYLENKDSFFCQVADPNVPKDKWLTRDNFTTASYVSDYPLAREHEVATKEDPNTQVGLVLTPEKDDEGNYSRFVKTRSDPQSVDAS